MNKYYPFKSKLEEEVANQLIDLDIKFKYELECFLFPMKIRNGECGDCKSKDVYRLTYYTPDFFLTDLNIIIETKGNFKSTDRSKILAFIEDNPDLDFRMVFQRNNKLRKNAKSRYSDWCEKYKIPYCFKIITTKWLDEK